MHLAPFPYAPIADRCKLEAHRDSKGTAYVRMITAYLHGSSRPRLTVHFVQYIAP